MLFAVTSFRSQMDFLQVIAHLKVHTAGTFSDWSFLVQVLALKLLLLRASPTGPHVQQWFPIVMVLNQSYEKTTWFHRQEELPRKHYADL